jgi:hypothetical protein
LRKVSALVDRKHSAFPPHSPEAPDAAFVRPGGAITFHVQYRVKGRRPMILIGEHPTMDIATARTLTRTILDLAKMGIDPQDGLEKRLVRELLEQGTAWRA